MSEENKIQLMNEALAFVNSFRSLEMATVNDQQTPEASYAPFILTDRGIYLYLSKLAKHTRNLLKNRRASLLFIEPESEAENIFARKRLSMQCQTCTIERDSDKWQQILDTMEQKHGETVQTIRQLGDFYLFYCQAENVNYVKGFAQAYRFDSEEWKKAWT